jgi:hypothetical protein
MASDIALMISGLIANEPTSIGLQNDHVDFNETILIVFANDHLIKTLTDILGEIAPLPCELTSR